MTSKSMLAAIIPASCLTFAAHPAVGQVTPATGTPDTSSAPTPIEAQASHAPATPVATTYPSAATGDGAIVGGYAPARWVEDWRSYRDPAKRDDPLDALKFIPIAANGNVHLTLSGELRGRINLTTNPGLLEARAQRQDIYRIFAGADLHLGNHVRVYGELARGAIDGVNLGTPSGSLRNKLVAQQLFIDATGDVGGLTVGARAGRQEFVDGPNLLLANRDNNTLHFTLNGVRAWARAASLRVDLFDFTYTRLTQGGIGDDPADPTRRFSGISAGIVLPHGVLAGSKLYLDPFFWRLRNRNALWGTTTAREERIYAGAHLWGDAGPLTLDWTVNHQGGRYDGRGINAWQVFLAQTYRIGKGPSAPRIGVHADYASGGGAFGTGTLNNAFAPFGNNIYYSYGLFLTPTNLIALAPNLTVSPAKAVRLTGEYQWAWRANAGDSVYRANGTAYARTQMQDDRRTADVARLQLIYTATPRLSFTLRLEHFMTRGGLQDVGYHDSSFVGTWINFRF